MKNKKFGLRIKDTDELLRCEMVRIKSQNETKAVYLLGQKGEQEWLLDSAEEVKEALNNPTGWHDSSEKHPYITTPKETLEIVEVTEIKRMDVYTEKSIYEDLDSYHRQKVEEALKRHTIEIEKKNEEIEDQSTEDMTNHFTEEPTIEEIQFFAPVKKPEENGVATLSKTVKAKVRCIKDIPKEMGSIRLKSDPVSFCFKEGKHYLAYVKQNKLFMMNEDKVPEFICNAPSEESWEDNIFFKRHFVIEDYLN